jgi:DNA-binding LacI/PurR family transcriptional regulator
MSQVERARIVKQRLSAPYKKIESDLRHKIRRGVWPVGMQIPSRKQLAREYGVDLSTIQKAMSGLLLDGVVASVSTRGTYVNNRPEGGDDPGGSIDPRLIGSSDRSVDAVGSSSRMPAAPAPIPAGKKTIGLIGRFAPEYSELLVPYMLAQTLENALSASKEILPRFFDCYRDEDHSIPICEGAAKLLGEGVDALCVIQPEPSDVVPIMQTAQSSATPVVFLSPWPIVDPVVQVYIDFRYDGFQAAKYYLDRGRTNLVFVMNGVFDWALERLEGVKAALRFAGLPLDYLQVVCVEPERRPGQQISGALVHAWVKDAIRSGTFGGAIIGANDYAALHVLEAAREAGVNAGRDFFVLGFDDIPESRRAGLTTLRPPLFDMGREAARLLTTMLAEGEIQGESLHVRLVSKLIERSTTI